eukprot:GHVH01017253.1.p2 GENE.GHVH01017253.1~~GHVH01017253.1.p2  ORF type:complete len:105 (+),score=20.22 GHVH01017253.1:521-835(+)
MYDGREVYLDASFRAKRFKALYEKKKLFEVKHITSCKSLVLKKDDYEISVEPNVDCLLAVTTCLILEDMFRGEADENESQKNHSSGGGRGGGGSSSSSSSSSSS